MVDAANRESLKRKKILKLSDLAVKGETIS